MPEHVVAPSARRAEVLRLGRETAAQAVRSLVPGGRIVGVTKGQFSLLDLIQAVLGVVGPAEVLVSTWTPGISEMERVCQLLRDCEITGFRLLVDRSFPSRHPQYVERVVAICGPDSIRMTRTHAKFALIAAGDYRIAIRTSMNFNSNPRFEQFDLDDDREIYDLFAGVAELLYETVPAGLTADPGEVQAAFAAALVGSPRRQPEHRARLARGSWSRSAVGRA